MDNQKSGFRYRKVWIPLIFIVVFAACCIPPAAASDIPTMVFPGKGSIDNVIYANAPQGYYYFKFNQTAGGGINAVHISSTTALDSTDSNFGQVTTTTSQSGTFYVTNTGGRGYDDDILLLVGVKGDIPDNFKIHITSSGYTWPLTGKYTYQPTKEELTYHTNIVDDTFTKSQFVYGPQTWKPCGNNKPVDYPLYYGQDMSDGTNLWKLMFVDLKVGNLGARGASLSSDDFKALTDYGAVKVDYTIENLDTVLTFNTYAWSDNAPQGHGISWTNGLTPPGDVPAMISGYTVLGPGYADRASEFPTTSGGTPVYHAPATNFTANVTSGTAPLTVQFNDTTTQTVRAWSWDFGDGSGSAEKNPVHTYSTAGTYTVSLTAASNQGMSATKTLSGFINVSRGTSYGSYGEYWTGGFLNTTPGVTYGVNFTANVTAGTAPLAVQFSDISEIPDVTTWSWDFTGDGHPESDGKNPVYVFRQNGNYTVNLTLTTTEGKVYSQARPRYIRVSDIPVLNSDEGWISADIPGAGTGSSSPGQQPSVTPARDPAVTVAAPGTAGSSPVGTKIAEVLFDSVVVIAVIGGGFFLWKKL